MKTIRILSGLCALGALSLVEVYAATIALGGPAPNFRTATLSDAVSGTGRTGGGNATEATVEGYYGGDWTERGSVAGASESGGAQSERILTVTLTTGTWGTKGPIAGTWQITDANFWSKYSLGAISLHVGGGQASPDHFVWQLTPNLLAGSFDYNGYELSGGGLSNLKLYSSGTGGDFRISDGGSTVALLGLGLSLLAFARRRFV